MHMHAAREASGIVASLMSTAPTSSRFIAYLLLTSSMALVGTYVALSKPLVAVIPVFALAFLRFAIASVAMLPWTFRAQRRVAADAHRAVAFLSAFVFRKFPVFDLHAERHRADDGNRCRRHARDFAGRRGVAVALVFARDADTAGVDRHFPGGGWHRVVAVGKGHGADA